MSIEDITDYSQAIEDAISVGAPQSYIDQLEEAREDKISAASDSQLEDWGINRAGQDTDVVPANGTVDLSENEMSTLTSNDGIQNDVTIVHADGTTEKVTGYILDGITYVLNADGSGTRLINYDGSGGLYTVPASNVTWDPTDHNGYAGSATLTLTDGTKVEVTATVSDTDDTPSSPSRSAYLTFSESPPTLTEDLEKVTKYAYFFGIDEITMEKNTPNPVCCFISKDIKIGELTDDEYIQLEASTVTNSNSSVEFSILDGGKEIPILPVGDTMVSNEKIFYGLRQRFSIDTSQSVTIKKDGTAQDITFDKAMQSNDALYTVDYTPLNAYSCKPASDTIKVKVVMRYYDNTADAPYVTKLKIRKYGGATLWAQSI